MPSFRPGVVVLLLALGITGFIFVRGLPLGLLMMDVEAHGLSPVLPSRIVQLLLAIWALVCRVMITLFEWKQAWYIAQHTAKEELDDQDTESGRDSVETSSVAAVRGGAVAVVDTSPDSHQIDPAATFKLFISTKRPPPRKCAFGYFNPVKPHVPRSVYVTEDSVSLAHLKAEIICTNSTPFPHDWLVQLTSSRSQVLADVIGTTSAGHASCERNNFLKDDGGLNERLDSRTIWWSLGDSSKIAGFHSLLVCANSSVFLPLKLTTMFGSSFTAVSMGTKTPTFSPLEFRTSRTRYKTLGYPSTRITPILEQDCRCNDNINNNSSGSCTNSLCRCNDSGIFRYDSCSSSCSGGRSVSDAESILSSESEAPARGYVGIKKLKVLAEAKLCEVSGHPGTWCYIQHANRVLAGIQKGRRLIMFTGVMTCTTLRSAKTCVRHTRLLEDKLKPRVGQARELIQNVCDTTIDRGRFPWLFHLLNGLEGESAALLSDLERRKVVSQILLTAYMKLDEVYLWLMMAVQILTELQSAQGALNTQSSPTVSSIPTPSTLQDSTPGDGAAVRAFLIDHPPISPSFFSSIHSAATSFSNPTLLSQCQTAQIRCQQAMDVFSAYSRTAADDDGVAKGLSSHHRNCSAPSTPNLPRSRIPGGPYSSPSTFSSNGRSVRRSYSFSEYFEGNSVEFGACHCTAGQKRGARCRSSGRSFHAPSHQSVVRSRSNCSEDVAEQYEDAVMNQNDSPFENSDGRLIPDHSTSTRNGSAPNVFENGVKNTHGMNDREKSWQTCIELERGKTYSFNGRSDYPHANSHRPTTNGIVSSPLRATGGNGAPDSDNNNMPPTNSKSDGYPVTSSCGAAECSTRNLRDAPSKNPLSIGMVNGSTEVPDNCRCDNERFCDDSNSMYSPTPSQTSFAPAVCCGFCEKGYSAVPSIPQNAQDSSGFSSFDCLPGPLIEIAESGSVCSHNRQPSSLDAGDSTEMAVIDIASLGEREDGDGSVTVDDQPLSESQSISLSTKASFHMSPRSPSPYRLPSSNGPVSLSPLSCDSSLNSGGTPTVGRQLSEDVFLPNEPSPVISAAHSEDIMDASTAGSDGSKHVFGFPDKLSKIGIKVVRSKSRDDMFDTPVNPQVAMLRSGRSVRRRNPLARAKSAGPPDRSGRRGSKDNGTADSIKDQLTAVKSVDSTPSQFIVCEGTTVKLRSPLPIQRLMEDEGITVSTSSSGDLKPGSSSGSGTSHKRRSFPGFAASLSFGNLFSFARKKPSEDKMLNRRSMGDVERGTDTCGEEGAAEGSTRNRGNEDGSGTLGGRRRLQLSRSDAHISRRATESALLVTSPTNGSFKKKRQGKTLSMATESSDSMPSLAEEEFRRNSLLTRSFAHSPVPVNTYLSTPSRVLPPQKFTSMADLRLTEADIQSRQRLAFLMEELVTTEKDYVQALELVVHHYIPELMREDVPQPLRGQKANIFGNIEPLYEFHRNHFLHEIVSNEMSPIGAAQCFLKYETELKMYASYSENKSRSDQLMTNHGARFFRERQEVLGDLMDLSSYLLKPVQRMAKYAMILQQLRDSLQQANNHQSLSSAAPAAHQAAPLSAAHSLVRFILQHSDDLLAASALGPCDLALSEQGQLLRQGPVVVNHKRRTAKRHLFLYEKALVFSKARRKDGSQDTYSYKFSLKAADIGLTETVGASGCSFEIWFRRSSGDKWRLEAPSASSKRQWISSLTDLLWGQALQNWASHKNRTAEQGVGSHPSISLQTGHNIHHRFVSTRPGLPIATSSFRMSGTARRTMHTNSASPGHVTLDSTSTWEHGVCSHFGSGAVSQPGSSSSSSSSMVSSSPSSGNVYRNRHSIHGYDNLFEEGSPNAHGRSGGMVDAYRTPGRHFYHSSFALPMETTPEHPDDSFA